MGLFDKVSGFIKREAEDIGEMADRARDRLDDELAEREAELEMTPAEKLRALQRKGRETDDRIDQIMEKAGVESAEADAVAEVQATAAPADMAPPSVTQIVLPDGSVRSGDDLTSEADEAAAEDAVPDQGDLAWIAPRDGEEAIVPAFSSAVQPASPSGPIASPTSEDTTPEPATPDQAAPDDTSAEHPGLEEAASVEASSGAVEPAAPQAATSEESTSALPPPPPPPPMAVEEPPAAEAPVAPISEDPPKRETPAEIAARVVAELEQAVADGPDPAPAPAPVPQAAPPKPEPSFDKTPAQRKYEEARRAADALLEELRGELRDDGEI